MKKITMGILSVLATVFCFGACDISAILGGMGLDSSSDSVIESATPSTESVEESQSESVSTEQPPEQPDEQPDEEGDTTVYLYNSFTPMEKNLFETYIGEVIPFLPNNEYYVEGYNAETDYENGMWYGVYDLTEAEYASYRQMYSAYEYIGSETDEEGDLWYTYQKDDVVVDMVFYTTEEGTCMEVFVVSDLSVGGDVGGDEGEATYKYTDFTTTEKNLFLTYIGEIIPFLPNNEYYVEGYYEETDYENGMWYGVYGLTEAEYASYRQMYSAYEYIGSEVDEDGDTWYTYQKDDIVVDMVFYVESGVNCMEVFVVSDLSNGGDIGGGDVGGGDIGGDEGEGTYKYTDFTTTEKNLFLTYIGEIIPFLPNNEYYVEGYYEETDYENGMWYGVYELTQSEFNSYRQMYSAYEYIGSETDEEGDLWYTYQKDDVVVEMVFYTTEEGTCMEVFVVSDLSVGGDVGGGDIGGGDVGGDEGGSTETDVDLLTNDGKGLPTGQNGVYTVDFTKAKYVKTVADQGYYLDGSPTTGNVRVLVIPVEFKDVTASSKGYTVDKIDKAFNGASGTTDLYSVKEYYEISSYHQLSLTFDVMDSWFRPQNDSSYYLNATMEYGGYEIDCGDQIILNEFLSKYNSTMDFSQYDSDGNGTIDAVVLINTLTIDSEVTMQWAYRYWNMYSDSNDEYYEYDGVYANDYMWASYQFLYEDENGEFNDKNAMNTYTFIHEFGHVLGAEDYYDTSYSGNKPMGDFDIMDGMFGDHNAYTKFNYGWLTGARLVTAEQSVTLSIEDFSKNGDAVIIANNWDDDLGAYQEYFIVVYYTNNGINREGGYFDEEGVVVYHVNASLYREEYEGEIYYDVYNTNTDASDEYGTVNNLIEIVGNGSGYVFGVGDSLSSVLKTDGGEKIAYTFTVNSIADGLVTVTFRKNV